MAGWIKIHRKMAEWEWYTEPNTFRLFMHLLLHANHEDKKWKGVDVPAGSLVTGRHSLAEKTGLSERQVRTALKNLKSTNEVTSKTSNKFSIISIVKWKEYQTSDQQSDQQTTSKRPASDQQATTNKNVKNDKKERNIGVHFDKWPSPPSQQVLADFKKNRKAAFTQTAIDRMASEIHKAVENGISVDDCLSVCCEAGWQGFKYEWYLNRERSNAENKSSSRQDKHTAAFERLKSWPD